VGVADTRTERDIRIYDTEVRADWFFRTVIADLANLGVGMLIAV
jgi:hypothetical protein